MKKLRIFEQSLSKIWNFQEILNFFMQISLVEFFIHAKSQVKIRKYEILRRSLENKDIENIITLLKFNRNPNHFRLFTKMLNNIYRHKKSLRLEGAPEEVFSYGLAKSK
jgi:hypothetical protein